MAFPCCQKSRSNAVTFADLLHQRGNLHHRSYRSKAEKAFENLREVLQVKNRTEAHLVSEYAQLIAHLQKQAVAIRPVGIMPLRVETYSLKEIIKCIDSLWRCIRRVLIRWKEIKHPDTFFHAFIFYFIIKSFYFTLKALIFPNQCFLSFQRQSGLISIQQNFPSFFKKDQKNQSYFRGTSSVIIKPAHR